MALADELGMEEAWTSEHVSPAELIICKAAAMTHQIKLGSAVRRLAYHHPLQVAIEANACDNLTEGRYQLGVGLGFGGGYMEQRGLDDSQRRDMLHAGIELILRLWSATEPFDYEGPYWQGKGLALKQAAVQQPHPPVAVAAARTLGTVQLAGEKGFYLRAAGQRRAGHMRPLNPGAPWMSSIGVAEPGRPRQRRLGHSPAVTPGLPPCRPYGRASRGDFAARVAQAGRRCRALRGAARGSAECGRPSHGGCPSAAGLCSATELKFRSELSNAR